MDMSSNTMTASLTCGSNDSVNGLKFGMKIYFEDMTTAGDGGGGGGGGGGSSKASSTTTAKKAKGVVQGVQQAPRCQVEGCNVDLSDFKAYYSRHKVCASHSKFPKVMVAGLEQRFCQQCSRFHQLPEFDQGKRSCRRRLAGHNERRRKPPPASGSLSSRMGRFSSSFPEDNNRYRGYMMDFSYARPGGPGGGGGGGGGHAMPLLRQGELNALPCGIAPHSFQFHPCVHGSTGETLFSGLGISPAGGASDSSCALSLLSNTQQWSSNITARNRPLMMHPMVQQEPVMAGSCFVSNSWEDFKDNGSHGSSEGLQLQRSMEMVNSHRFSGELELALQRNSAAFGHSDGANHNHSL